MFSNSGKRHHVLELEDGHPGGIGIRAPAIVEQNQNAHPPVGLAIDAGGELTQFEYADRLAVP